MFDFISYVRDSALEVKILPVTDGILISLEVRDPETGYFERGEITDKEAAGCGNIDTYTGLCLDRMAAKIGSRKARLYADRFKGEQRRELEDFWRNK